MYLLIYLVKNETRTVSASQPVSVILASSQPENVNEPVHELKKITFPQRNKGTVKNNTQHQQQENCEHMKEKKSDSIRKKTLRNKTNKETCSYQTPGWSREAGGGLCFKKCYIYRKTKGIQSGGDGLQPRWRQIFSDCPETGGVCRSFSLQQQKNGFNYLLRVKQPNISDLTWEK